MKTKWTIDAAQSEVLLKSRKNTIGYLDSNNNTFEGHVDFNGSEVENASIAFSMGMHDLKTIDEMDSKFVELIDLFNMTEIPVMRFQSTSFEKINKNINFFKGNLTINDITRVVEFQAEYIDTDLLNGNKKVAFEITGNINRQDFGIKQNPMRTQEPIMGKDIKFIANFEFTK